MHKSGIILLALGGVILLVGIIGFVVGGANVEKAAEFRPDTKAVWKGSASDGPQKVQFKGAGEHQVWYVQGSAKPSIRIVDSNGVDYFMPLAPGTTFTLNGFDQLGSFTPASATEEYTVTVEGGAVHATNWTKDEMMEAFGALAAGFGIGCCATGSGGFLMLLGLILGLALKKKTEGV